MAEPGTTGLFGKLPAHGDFVRRGLPRSFIGPWDDWLSAGIEASRHDLGAGWDHAWETAPAWRFRLAPGACGPDAAVGVVIASADTVGRRFPLTLAAVLPAAAIPPPEAWFDALEAAAWQGRKGEVDADGLLALLPPSPPDDPDATLDGRSLFWSTGIAPLRMPLAIDFARLLGAPEGPPHVAGGLPFIEAEADQADGEDVAPNSLSLPGDMPLDDGWVPLALPFTEPLPLAVSAKELAADTNSELLWLDPADGPGEGLIPAEPATERGIEPPGDIHVWGETVELPWAAAAPGTDDPNDPDAGAAA